MADYLEGIGYHRIKQIDSAGRTIFDYTFPYCEVYEPTWEPVETNEEAISLADDSYEVVQDFIGYWGKWKLSWMNKPLKKADAQKAIDCLNAKRNAQVIQFWPRYTDNPDYMFEVVIIGSNISPRAMFSRLTAYGTVGIEIYLQTKRTQVDIYVPPPVEPEIWTPGVEIPPIIEVG
jgi:hypothetical protein